MMGFKEPGFLHKVKKKIYPHFMWMRYLDKKNRQYEESRGIIDPYDVLKADRKKALKELAASRRKAKPAIRMYGPRTQLAQNPPPTPRSQKTIPEPYHSLITNNREIRGMSERERKALRQRSAWAERTEYMEHFNETMRANQPVGISASNLRDKVAERQRVAAGRDKQRRPGGWA